MIRVTCGIIRKGERILATRRCEGMHLEGKWEFPGGKVKNDEPDDDCLVRELEEELGIRAECVRPLNVSVYDYGSGKVIELVPFVCDIISGEIVLSDHSEMQWCSQTELRNLSWCPADVPIVEQVLDEWDAVIG